MNPRGKTDRFNRPAGTSKQAPSTGWWVHGRAKVAKTATAPGPPSDPTGALRHRKELLARGSRLRVVAANRQQTVIATPRLLATRRTKKNQVFGWPVRRRCQPVRRCARPQPRSPWCLPRKKTCRWERLTFVSPPQSVLRGVGGFFKYSTNKRKNRIKSFTGNQRFFFDCGDRRVAAAVIKIRPGRRWDRHGPSGGGQAAAISGRYDGRRCSICSFFFFLCFAVILGFWDLHPRRKRG